MRVCGALALVVLLLVSAAAEVIEVTRVLEETDVSSLTEALTTVSVSLPSDYVSTKVTDADLEGLCETHFPQATSCSAKRTATGSEAGVVVSITERPILLLEGFERDGMSARVTLNLAYVPRQFPITGGYDVKERLVNLRLPTHRTVLRDIENMRFNITFSLTWQGDELDLSFPAPDITAGDRIAIPAPGGSLCGAALLGPDGALLARTLSFGCERFDLGTSGDTAAGIHDLYIFSITGRTVKLARRSVKVKASALPFTASSDKQVVYLGSDFTVSTSSAQELEACDIRIRDPQGAVVEAVHVESCKDVAIGTATAWAPGTYTVEVRAQGDDRTGSSTFSVEFRGLGYTAAATKTDKNSYTAGETIAAHTEADGDLCKLELVDSEHVRVSEQEVPGCTTCQLPIDEGVPSGDYVLKTMVYKGGKLKAVASTGIEIKEWRPAIATAMSDLCMGGSFPVGRYKLPCIPEGASCLPTSHAAPVCLCFSEEKAVDVCAFNARCTSDGCREPELVRSPFIIVYERGECLAKHGIQTLSCIEVSEICNGNCVCLNEDRNAVSSCITGDVCTPGGCQPLVLEFELDGLSTDHARSDAIERGTELAWTGHLRFKGKLLDGSKTNQVVVSGRLGGLASMDERVQYISPAQGWRISMRFRGELEPGLTDAFLLVEFGGDTHIIRRPFEVWFPEELAELDISFKTTSPNKVSLQRLEFGTSVKAVTTITDKKGTDITFLPRDAVKLAIGNLDAMAVTPTYDPLTGWWDVVGTFRSATRPKGNFITLSVNYLGRKGSAWEGFMVLDQTPLAVKVTKVEPGMLENPLFVLLATLGFDMDVYLQLESPVQLDKGSFKVSIGSYDVSPDITYVTMTSVGTRIHLSDVRLCPQPPAPGSRLRVTIGVEVGDEYSEDSTFIQVQGNPGNWKNTQEASC